MRVKRIVTNINTQNVPAAKNFYQDVLELDLLMNHGWIETYGLIGEENVQISIATQGGSNTSTPDLSIEVDDVDEAYERMKSAGYTIEYDLTDELWGVRRFYVRDPFGKLINILAHIH
ncbi:VOC family protein [Paenibacillus taichungensis]|uniref:VOC family protein n=1 Tax=Paenibacillus taichungensis TaxID=484184 RepID=UPI002DBD4185|nr:VOC family protein [Paenibacillus taichungensis]MEC0111447.1 VOC family protein [Paenibacillus taichungensis]MEC0199007.1 VOC family protein [Paenibacillus taichungensis]